MNRPAWPKGGSGAAHAVPAVARHTTAAAMPPRIAGRLPHLAAWDVHLGRPLTGLGARPRAARRAARLPLGVHHSLRRARPADGGGRACLTVLAPYATVWETIRVGTGVMPIHSRAPAATAQQAVTIDEI